jgi:hypothetical protein
MSKSIDDCRTLVARIASLIELSRSLDAKYRVLDYDGSMLWVEWTPSDYDEVAGATRRVFEVEVSVVE